MHALHLVPKFLQKEKLRKTIREGIKTLAKPLSLSLVLAK
jgi:hypothetical protein